MDGNLRSDAAGFTGDGKPPKIPMFAAGFGDDRYRPQANIVLSAIDEAISSLGGSIHKTITWHMNNRGVFADPKKIDIAFFYNNLKELVGPGADMIMEDIWEHLQRRHARHE